MGKRELAFFSGSRPLFTPFHISVGARFETAPARLLGLRYRPRFTHDNKFPNLAPRFRYTARETQGCRSNSKTNPAFRIGDARIDSSNARKDLGGGEGRVQ